MRDSNSSGDSPHENSTRDHSIAWAVETTRSLLDRAQNGDDQALEAILDRYLPRLMRWATGRLPRAARDVVDTEDLVQDSLIKVVRTLGGIRKRHPGTFPSYLRKAVLNRLHDEVRRAARRPGVSALDGTEMDPSPSPLEETIGREAADRYESALLRLSDRDRGMIFLRIEMGLSYPEMADTLGDLSADTARQATNRAVVRLATELRDARST
jgi:RNA polymerase sigma-70 factor (ECF subfamily)